jgi:hypothetical protein
MPRWLPVSPFRLRVKHEGSKVPISHSELVRFAKENHPDPIAPVKKAS